ncbi:MAG: NfeD family protein [Planctomycetes bacterium]|nr:NfeD family protein [Planctomycetota bacterium]
MTSIYWYSAVVGGTVLVVQVLLLALGVGAGDHSDVDPGDVSHGDAGHGHAGADSGDAGWFFKVLSFKTLVAFATFFGLSGLAAESAQLGHGLSLGLAVAAGFVALFTVAWLMEAMHSLQSSGNLDLGNAVGANATVHLRIPGTRTGQGKVLLSVQGRKVECKAVTPGEPIATGAEVRVVGLDGPDVLAVVPLPKESR